MKFAIVDVIKSGDKKDFNGGFGTSFDIGGGFFLKILKFLRNSNEFFPITLYGIYIALLKNQGHEVYYAKNRVPDNMDVIIMHVSLVRNKEELDILKKIRRTQSSFVMLIGPAAFHCSKKFEGLYDLIVHGDLEPHIREISSIDDLPRGISDFNVEHDLDSLPLPDWGLFDISKFSQFPLLKRKPTAPVLANRGCVFKCNYCPYVVNGSSNRRRSVLHVIKEIKYLKNCGFKSILFRDPTFTLNKKWIEEFCNAIIAENIEIEFACETRTDCLTEDLVKKMFEAGLRAVKVGVESFDHRSIEKHSRIAPKKETQETIINYCESLGIRVAAFYILGLDSDTANSMQTTIDYSLYLGSSYANFNICTPLPGTKFYDEVKDKIFDHNLNHYDNFTPVFYTKCSTPKEIKYFQQKAFSKFYFRPSLIMKRMKDFF
ncbi:B12-binding domain-containing radical SAM protein [Desulfobacter curvatus]|uniref:B12-binding domain-containing radical SAM protein n=1 Tax=Desulfobacter curvatus TaxID=2290 RepID=UPI0003669C8B|nr:radical SAM protein [Desulfobacter curvatus]